MHEMRILTCLAIICSFSDDGLAQELRTWTNNAGKSIEAMFFKLDDAARSVTILVPKTVAFADLDDGTIALAKSEAKRVEENRKARAHEIPHLNVAERTVIHLLDPRIVRLTKNTLSTNYGNDKTDILATKTLSKSESRKLWISLEVELEDNTDVPFCGHFPAYAVQVYRGEKLVSSTTVCGLCMTWARKGEFKRLKGKESLAILASHIALPDVFAKKSVPDLMEMKEKPILPFHELDCEK
jgi:hypothetical protein